MTEDQNKSTSRRSMTNSMLRADAPTYSPPSVKWMQMKVNESNSYQSMRTEMNLPSNSPTRMGFENNEDTDSFVLKTKLSDSYATIHHPIISQGITNGIPLQDVTGSNKKPNKFQTTNFIPPTLLSPSPTKQNMLALNNLAQAALSMSPVSSHQDGILSTPRMNSHLPQSGYSPVDMKLASASRYQQIAASLRMQQMGLKPLEIPPTTTVPYSADGHIYQVHFKRAHRNFVLSPNAPKDLKLGEFVKVEADRGEDLGVIVAKVPIPAFEEVIPTAGYRGRGYSSGPTEKKFVTRRATLKERSQLIEKVHDEETALEVIRRKTEERNLPMTILDAEYQFDRHKLIFFFEADRRIDFRELVSDLFSLYKTRIWMQQVDTSSLPDQGLRTSIARSAGLLPSSYTPEEFAELEQREQAKKNSLNNSKCGDYEQEHHFSDGQGGLEDEDYEGKSLITQATNSNGNHIHSKPHEKTMVGQLQSAQQSRFFPDLTTQNGYSHQSQNQNPNQSKPRRDKGNDIDWSIFDKPLDVHSHWAVEVDPEGPSDGGEGEEEPLLF